MAQPVSKYFNINKTTSSTASSQQQTKPKINLFDFKTTQSVQPTSFSQFVQNKTSTPQNIMNFGPGVSQKGVTNVNEYNPVTKKTENIFTPKPTTAQQSSGFSLIPTANASNEQDFISELEYDIKNGASKEEIKQAYPELNNNDTLINELHYDISNGSTLDEIKQAYPELNQPQEEQGFFESIKYKPYSQEELTSYDPNKTTTQNILEGQGKYAKNIAGGLYNIVPGIAEMGTNLVTGTAKDVGMKVGNLFGLVSDEDRKAYDKAMSDKTGQIVGGVAKDYATKYGSVEGFKNAVMTDPTAIVGDALSVVGVGIAGKSKLTNIQKSALETQKSNIINQVKNATTLEEKSNLIKQGIEASKQIAEKTKQVKTLEEAQGIVNKYNPYIQAPILATKGVQITGEVLTKGGKTIVKKLTPDLQKTASTVSTKANRFNAVDEEKFIKTTGQTPGEFAVERGMTDVGDKAVEKATQNYLTSMKQADDAFENVGGNFKYDGKGNDPIKLSLDDLETRGVKTEADFTPRIQELKTKYETEGLTMPEINEVKREYARNFKYGFEDRNSEALARSTNIQNKLREWQLNKADEMGVSNIKDINKNTQAWKLYADALEKKLNRSGANNAVSITDWIALSGGNATNVALFLGKKLGTSNKAKELLIKAFGKQTKNSIIAPDINKPQIKGLLPRGAIITPAPKMKSNIKVTPSVIQPNTQKALPPGKIVTPQTSEKGVIQESKIPLKNTKYGTNTNIPSNMTNTRTETILKPNKPTNKPAPKDMPIETDTPITNAIETGKGSNLKNTFKGNEDVADYIDNLIENSNGKTSKEIAEKVQRVIYNKGIKLTTLDAEHISKYIDEFMTGKTNKKLGDIIRGKGPDEPPALGGTKLKPTPKQKPTPAVSNKTEGETPLITNQPKNAIPNQTTKISSKDGKLKKKSIISRILPSNFKEKAQDLVDKTMEKIGGKMNIMGNEGIGADKTALLKGSDDLISEARKFKTFDEFKKSQGQELYHGTSSDFVEFLKEKMGTGEGSDLFGRGIYLTDNNKIADFYAKNAYKISNKSDKVKNIMNTYINKNAKIKDLTSEKIGDFVNELNNWIDNNKGIAPGLENNKYGRWLHADMTPGELGQAIVQSGNKGILTKFLEEKGYGGIKFKANQIQQIKGKKGINFVIFDPENIKTESQLKQIYEQSKPKLLKKTSKN